MSNRHTRREVLAKGAKAAAGLTIISSPLLRAGVALAATPVRRDVVGMTASDPILVSYAKAIKAMQALPATNPLSWTYQAAIHGNLVLPPQPAWNTCQHGNYYFWSWHRMYLHYFEQIIQKMSGDPSFTLPFWNYESPTERQLPAPFRDPSSPLYVSQRDPGFNNGTSSLLATDVDTSGGFALTNFTSASGSIESTPHGVVHVRVGGASGWMGSVPTAAQDPIFYLHHANIDRLWNLWLAQGGGRANPLSDVTWKTKKFTFFDPAATPVTLNGCDVLRAADQLDYTYQGEPLPQVNEFCLRFLPPWIYKYLILWRPPIPPQLLLREEVTLTLDPRKFAQQLLSVSQSPTQTLFLRLDNVEAARQPGVVWQVFVGAQFVGNITMFGMGVRNQGKEFMPASFTFPVDRAMQAALKGSPSSLAIRLVPTGPLVNGKPALPKPASSIKIGSFSFVVETATKR